MSGGLLRDPGVGNGFGNAPRCGDLAETTEPINGQSSAFLLPAFTGTKMVRGSSSLPGEVVIMTRCEFDGIGAIDRIDRLGVVADCRAVSGQCSHKRTPARTSRWTEIRPGSAGAGFMSQVSICEASAQKEQDCI